MLETEVPRPQCFEEAWGTAGAAIWHHGRTMSEQPKGREWLGIAASFLAGAAGTAGTAFVGRLADARARGIREHWSSAVRRARIRLESL